MEKKKRRGRYAQHRAKGGGSLAQVLGGVASFVTYKRAYPKRGLRTSARPPAALSLSPPFSLPSLSRMATTECHHNGPLSLLFFSRFVFFFSLFPLLTALCLSLSFFVCLFAVWRVAPRFGAALLGGPAVPTRSAPQRWSTTLGFVLASWRRPHCFWLASCCKRPREREREGEAKGKKKEDGLG